MKQSLLLRGVLFETLDFRGKHKSLQDGEWAVVWAVVAAAWAAVVWAVAAVAWAAEAWVAAAEAWAVDARWPEISDSGHEAYMCRVSEGQKNGNQGSG
jgi:hypothetical protein